MRVLISDNKWAVRSPSGSWSPTETPHSLLLGLFDITSHRKLFSSMNHLHSQTSCILSSPHFSPLYLLPSRMTKMLLRFHQQNLPTGDSSNAFILIDTLEERVVLRSLVPLLSPCVVLICFVHTMSLLWRRGNKGSRAHIPGYYR